MKTTLLFHNRFKKIGWLLIIISIGFQLYKKLVFTRFVYFPFLSSNTLTNHIRETNTIQLFDIDLSAFLILSLLGFVLIIFSKEKVEDELVSNIRLNSFIWSVFISYTLFLVLTISVYGKIYLIGCLFNIYTIPLVYLIRFNFLLYKNSFYNQSTDEQ